ncbi:uncoordinated protein 58-like [Mya arenaria]|uniref:uncoordinated protein 58-like n=1 Tax=Mya arenaria TaxID=6604 RepID=UPI0022E93AE1|nr:uncoordinated protein 58-like [Mya arenaria]
MATVTTGDGNDLLDYRSRLETEDQDTEPNFRADPGARAFAIAQDPTNLSPFQRRTNDKHSNVRYESIYFFGTSQGSAVTRRIRLRMPTPFNDLDGTSMKDIRLLYKLEGSMDADDGHLSVSAAGSTDTLATDVTVSSEKLDQPEGCLGKTKRVAQTVYKAARSLVGLIIILIAYTALGAAIFMAVESYHEQKYKSNITDIRKNLITQLLQSVNQVQGVNKFRAVTTNLLVDYESSIREAIKNDVTTDSTVEVWTYWDSLFFVWTVYTTIGYGNIYPVTGIGRMLTIVYASVGIPLVLLVLAEQGKVSTRGLKYLWAFLRRYYYTGYFRKVRSSLQHKYQVALHAFYQLYSSAPVLVEQAHVEAGEADSLEAKSLHSLDDEATAAAAGQRSRSSSKVVNGYEVDDEFNLPISIAIGILFVYIMLGATMYMIWEDWTFIESFYFVFVSLSTIGFGDVLPAHQKFFIISSIYMCVGLSLVSMCINVAVEFFHSMSKRAKKKMGEAKRKIGDKVNQASKNAREKVSDMKHNIKDETSRLRQKTDARLTNLRTNITDETSKFKHKTDKAFTGIKTNISNETTRFKKRADEKFRKRGSTPDGGSSANISREKLATVGIPEDIPAADDTYKPIGDVQSNTSENPISPKHRKECKKRAPTPPTSTTKSSTRSPTKSPTQTFVTLGSFEFL